MSPGLSGDGSLIGWSSMDSMDLDEDRRKALKRRVYKTYLEISPAKFAALQTARSDRQYEEMRDLAHYLKSSSANLGAAGLAELLADVQQVNEAGAHERLPMLIERTHGDQSLWCWGGRNEWVAAICAAGKFGCIPRPISQAMQRQS